MAAELTDRVFVVTGAASGIGRAIATRCVAAGAKVMFADIDGDGALAAAASSGGGGHAAAIACDVRDRAQIEAMIGAAVERFGRLDGVAANAGGSGGRTRMLLEVEEQEWRDIVDLNLTATFLTLQAGARVLVQQGDGGVLLATGSSTGIRAMTGRYAYMASKAGIHHLVRALALEMAEHAIRVNAIVPGVTDTPAIYRYPGHAERSKAAVPLGSLVPPDEIGGLAVFLFGDDARHMTGAVLTHDAGRTIA